MKTTIGQLAEQILDEVKKEALVKIAQREVVKEASKRPNLKTDVGKLLHKFAEELRNAPQDVSVQDVKDFLKEAGHAS